MPADAADAVAVLLAHLPGYRVDSVVVLGEGQENVAYEVNGDLIVRFSKEPDPARRAALLDREARLLAAVAAIAPLPVPTPVFADAERGCLAYRKLPGVPLVDLPRDDLDTSTAAALGDLLTALHAVPVEHVTDLVDTDDQPLPGWLSDAREQYEAVAGRVPAAHRRGIEEFLAAAPPPAGYTRVFSHNDLGIEHVLVDPPTRTVTGVIDWTDAAITDPAYDFGLLHRDLGPDAARAAIARYRTGANDVAALAERAVFYARCSVFEDLAYGLETGRNVFVDKSLAAMGWLFPAPI
jgi:aminoglycoside phosphotransferase (APT) family kinase protein